MQKILETTLKNLLDLIYEFCNIAGYQNNIKLTEHWKPALMKKKLYKKIHNGERRVSLTTDVGKTWYLCAKKSTQNGLKTKYKT